MKVELVLFLLRAANGDRTFQDLISGYTLEGQAQLLKRSNPFSRVVRSSVLTLDFKEVHVFSYRLTRLLKWEEGQQKSTKYYCRITTSTQPCAIFRTVARSFGGGKSLALHKVVEPAVLPQRLALRL